jgi:hypothetical protein
MVTTIESIGATHYTLASPKNFKDNTKKVIIRVYKDDTYAYLTCSDKLSEELRSCTTSEELNTMMLSIKDLIIGEELEVLS